MAGPEVEEDSVPPSAERLALVVDVWKYIVSVQMHFNDMEMKVRNLYFTIVAAAMGLIGVLAGKRIDILWPGVTISLSLVVILAIIPISLLFYFMDRHWYHRFLLGAVDQCVEIEKQYSAYLPEIQLGSKISKISPVKFPGRLWKILFFFVQDERFRKCSNIHSDAKIEIIYKSVSWGCVAIFVVYAPTGGILIGKDPLLPLVIAFLANLVRT